MIRFFVVTFWLVVGVLACAVLALDARVQESWREDQ
jgi:hypothetical protein